MAEFREIAHSGGKITFDIVNGPDGQQMFNVGISSSSPNPQVLVGIYAIHQGIPVAPLHLHGLGAPMSPPPFPGCLPVLIQSDSEGHFGHNCPKCKGYWRSGPWPRCCPYCSIRAPEHRFLSDAQLRFVRHYCETLTEALDGEDGQAVIDMDAVADATGSAEKPAFYVSEESQQRKFTCAACGEFNDILGRFGGCSGCATRSDFAEFERLTIAAVREKLRGGAEPEGIVRDGVSAFDTLVGQYAKQLIALVPMTDRRRTRLNKQRFHDLKETRGVLRDWFDIDICEGLDEPEIAMATLMFHRRHVYEHNGGEADEKYLKDSGDTTVKLKQALRETSDSAHKLLGTLLKLAKNLHVGFHSIIPPIQGPIDDFAQRKKAMKTGAGQGA